MEPEYSNGWDDNIDSGLGGNDASSTALRRYSPSPSPKRNLSRSRSRSPIRQSLNNGNNGGGYSRHDEGRRNYRRRSRSRSPANNNRRHGRPFYRDGSRSRTDDRYRRGPSPGRRDRRSRSPNSSFMPQAPPRQARENPEPTNVLGVFNLDYYTDERELRDLFSPFGGLERVVVVMDRRNQRSRGFAFVYFSDVNCAARAREATNGKMINDRGIRVDFSITREAHKPTPGVYMGEMEYNNAPSNRGRDNRRGGGDRGGRGGGGGRGGDRYGRHGRRRSRSRSRSRSRDRYERRSNHRISPPAPHSRRYRSRSRSR